jgi:hypothetical protein
MSRVQRPWGSICVFLLTAVAVAGDPPKTDADRIQGTWRWKDGDVRAIACGLDLLSLIHGRDVGTEELTRLLAAPEELALAVKGDRFNFSSGPPATATAATTGKLKGRQAVAKIGADKNPREIDLVVGGGKPFLCIYKFGPAQNTIPEAKGAGFLGDAKDLAKETGDGDLLTLCIGSETKRPTAFEAKDGQLLIQYTRYKK